MSGFSGRGADRPARARTGARAGPAGPPGTAPRPSTPLGGIRIVQPCPLEQQPPSLQLDRSLRSAWPRASPHSRCFAARSSRSAPRPIATGSAWSATTARSPKTLRRHRGVLATTRASCSPLSCSGSASTGTSSGRCRSRRPRPSSWRSPTRTTAGTQDKLEMLLARDRRRAARVQRCPHRRRGRRGARRHVLAAAPQQPRRHRLGADGELGHGRGLTVPARAARRRASVPARAVRTTSTTTGSASPLSRSATWRSSRALSTTTSSTVRRCSDTPRRTG